MTWVCWLTRRCALLASSVERGLAELGRGGRGGTQEQPRRVGGLHGVHLKREKYVLRESPA